MSVINTNYLALVSQSNLTKSQNALGTAIERLSSGLRINSAKDDAAGQAIANRFTANIKGLTQAARNANDGISIAQTTEGALNEINNNLQRIRELSVQAANGSNSPTDLDSIQAEIQQRLDEIDRVSAQTQFNGVKVLASNNTLTVQVGAHDNETIDVNLKEITAGTLGLGSFNVNAIKTSSLSEALTKAGTGSSSVTVNVAPNSAVPGTGGPTDSAITSKGVYALSNGTGYVVKGSDDNFYALQTNTVTGKHFFDSSTAKVDAATVDVAGGAVTSVKDTIAAGTLTVATTATTPAVNGEIVATGTAGKLADGTTTFAIDTAAGLFVRNDKATATGLAEYAVKGNDGKFYGVTATARDATNGIQFSINYGSLEEISAANVGAAAATRWDVGTTAVSSDGNLLNVDIVNVPTSAGLYALNDGTGYVVKDNNGRYFAATDAGDGKFTWNSSTATSLVNEADVDVAGGALSTIANGSVTGTYQGLAAGETLHSYQDADGKTAYVVKGGTATDPTYTKATLGTADPATGNIQVTKATGDDAALDVRTNDPLKALDAALQQVDTLRSDLGAIQNRFQSTIANLSNTVNNLSAARSRIEDADYAVEVSNMTRAQILQQAGTSVLAQANQVPQTVLSLLR